MCDTCGCTITPGNSHLLEHHHQVVPVLEGLLAENDRTAAHNRQHLDQHRVLALNLMSSPGAGKTALLEATLDTMRGKYRCAVLVGDLATDNDARRISAHGVHAIQISTGSACHLDAHLVHQGLHQLDLAQLDLLFIENVGNLVCPASFDLGQHHNITLLSTTEGDDKPSKYPVMFRQSDLMLISKTDLLPYLDDFSPDRAEQALRDLANPAPVYALSAKTGAGLSLWLHWLDTTIARHQARLGHYTPVPAISLIHR